MMRSGKSNTTLFLEQFMMIGLITLAIWIVAAYGWKQALGIANNSDLHRGEIHFPSFSATLLVLPVPYGIYIFFKYLVQKHPRIHWKTSLDYFIMSALILILLTQGLFLCSLIFMEIYGGGLDIMLSWEAGIVFVAAGNALPITTLITFVTLLVFVGRRNQNHAYWLLLPGSVASGLWFFRLTFLLWGLKA